MLIGLIALGVVVSPLFMFVFQYRATQTTEETILAKEWSEIIGNVFTALGVLGGSLALIGWAYERQDRNTEFFMGLAEQFSDGRLDAGKDVIESGEDPDENARWTATDRLLRFYVIIHGVWETEQAPRDRLRAFFRFWLAHYYRKDRAKFRTYVNTHYPTLRKWLLADAKILPREDSFFRPEDFWLDGKFTVKEGELYPDGN